MMRALRWLTAFCMAVLLSMSGAAAEDTPALLQVHQIAIGQADAYLIKCGDMAVMIDGGNARRQTPDEMMDYLRQAGITSLDACIVTHYHADHAANINLLLSEFGREDTIVFGPTEQMDKQYLPLDKGEYRQMKDGDEVSIGEVRFKCVGPDTVEAEGTVNEDSLNVLMTYGRRTFLFTGDAVRSQSVMRRHQMELKNVDVLKFPHHGLRPFAVEEWALKLMNPAVVLIPGFSGHDVQAMMEQNGLEAEIYDMGAGHVVVLSDGESLTVIKDARPGQFAQR